MVPAGLRFSSGMGDRGPARVFLEVVSCVVTCECGASVALAHVGEVVGYSNAYSVDG